MLAFVLWYCAALLLGWLAFPLAHKLLPRLPDRGYTLSRALGLLIWGYAFWFLASIGILRNDIAGMLFALVVLVLLSLWAGWSDRFAGLLRWLKENTRLVITSEAVFLLAFAAWTVVRAANPDVSSTEKPMEMAFINAILRSPTFPPHDPWLSGYAISYYYFGYVMVAMLIKVTGVASSVAFNLAVALWFALTGLGVYGLVYNLLARRRIDLGEKDTPGLYSLSVLGPVFILIVCNFEGILDMLHSWGLFWHTGASGEKISSFWQWLDIQELTQAPQQFSLLPTRPGGIVWWRASRVLQDYGMDGSSREIIDEFPFFSYLLGDLHPHVLVMPFALLAISLALHFLLSVGSSHIRMGRFTIPMGWDEFLLASLVLGGLGFLNTWDFPIYVALFSAVYAFSQYRQHGWSSRRMIEFLRLGLVMGISGFLLYLPFYLGLQSQANGFLPSLAFFTRGVHFWVMFGPLLIPVFMLVLVAWRRKYSLADLKKLLLLAAAVITGLLGLSFLLGIAISFLPHWGSLFLQNQGASNQSIGELLWYSLSNRLKAPGTWLTLGLLLVFALLRLHQEKAEDELDAGISHPTKIGIGSQQFILLLVILGIFLTLVPEFFYLLDQFGWRMNTIFKLYFQTWIVWGVAAAYASAVLFEQLPGLRSKATWAVGFTLMLLTTFVYPVYSLVEKTEGFKPSTGYTLNGTVYLDRYSPDDAAAIRWLQASPLGVVCEAVGGQYTGYARISTFSGLPSVLGWPGHVSQWRGGAREIGSRQTDIETIYYSSDWQTTLDLLKKYNIRYIYIGDMERSTYRVNEVKFTQHLSIIYQVGSITIYEVPEEIKVNEAQAGIGSE